jgi:hypothetical protein
MASGTDLLKNHLDCLLHFFLKYYRDDMAEVDHLDLESADGPKSPRQRNFSTHKAQRETKSPSRALI